MRHHALFAFGCLVGSLISIMLFLEKPDIPNIGEKDENSGPAGTRTTGEN